ncbi:MAG: isoprenylcysteine carboxylmethyltransferase family protein [Sphingobacteriales bacterium]|nr:MAG: isoprenylcysteine carboxylmethyltransferase family protein [Sphingobacteriales bacterium]
MIVVIKYFSALFFLTYVVVAFVLPSARAYALSRVNPITFGRSDTVHDYVGRWFKIILAFIPFAIIVFIIDRTWYEYLLPAHFLEEPEVQLTGIVLCLLSLAWTIIAQWHMGSSWRIGIDENHTTDLRQNGAFKYSRNPIFLGMLVTLTGFFFLLPNAITLVVLVVGYLLIQVQVRLEEEFLSKQHGEAYYLYRKEVRRWL